MPVARKFVRIRCLVLSTGLLFLGLAVVTVIAALLYTGQRTNYHRHERHHRKIILEPQQKDCWQKFVVDFEQERSKWFHRSLPIPVSIVPLRNETLTIFWTGKVNASTYRHWTGANWTCSTGRGKVVKPRNAHFSAQTTLVLQCPALKKKEQELTVQLGSSAIAKYERLPVCPTPIKRRQTFYLASCTKVFGRQRPHLPEWIEYHRLLGVEYFLIYVFEPNVASTVALLQRFIDAEIVQVIPFYFGESFSRLFFQAAFPMDCIYRLRGLTRWIAIHDIDEYFQPMNPSVSTLRNYLSQFDANSSVISVEAENWFFGPKSSDRGDKIPVLTHYTWRARNPWPALTSGRQKSIVKPDLVDYFHTHLVGAGASPMRVIADPINDLRLVHYRRPALGDFAQETRLGLLVQDLSMKRTYGSFVKRRLQRWQQHREAM